MNLGGELTGHPLATAMREDQLIDQLARANTKCLRQPLNNFDRRVARSSFEIADVSPMDIGLMGELLLAPAFLKTELAQVCGEALTNIHARN